MDTKSYVSKAGPSKILRGLVGVVVNTIVAILIWLLGAYILLPQVPRSTEALGITAQVVSAIVLVAALFAVVRVFLSARDLWGALAERLVGPRAEGQDGYKTATRLIFDLVFGLVTYALLYVLLGSLYEPMRGIGLGVFAIWAVLFLFQLGDIFSPATERATQMVWRSVERVAH